jgi:hypothetical protein
LITSTVYRFITTGEVLAPGFLFVLGLPPVAEGAVVFCDEKSRFLLIPDVATFSESAKLRRTR